MSDEIISQLDRSVRSSSLAETCEASNGYSRFGVPILMRPDESWPACDGQELDPLIQIHVAELPVIPSLCSNIALITAFANEVELQLHEMVNNGNNFLVRTYASLDGLIEKTPNDIPYARTSPLKWVQCDDDGPTWIQITQLLDQLGQSQLSSDSDFFNTITFPARYSQHLQTKVGGWPTPVQNSNFSPESAFVFQVTTNWNGVMCFFVTPQGGWTMYADC